MTAAGEVSWPPAGSFLAAYGEDLMAADSFGYRLALTRALMMARTVSKTTMATT